MRAGAVRIATVVLGLVAAACGSGSPATPHTRVGPAGTPTAPGPEGAPTTPGDDLGPCDAVRYNKARSVVLVRPGAEPRSAVRVQPSLARYRVRITEGAAAHPREVELMLMPAREVRGQLCFPFEVTRQTLSRSATARTTGSFALTPDGAHQGTADNSSMTIPDYFLHSHLNDLLDDLPLAIPSEPVGIGAVWMAEDVLTINTFRTERRSTYRLVSSDASGVTFDLDLEQRIPPQQWSGANAGNDQPFVSRVDRATGRLLLVSGAPIPRGTIAWKSAWHSQRSFIGEPPQNDSGSGTSSVRYDVERFD